MFEELAPAASYIVAGLLLGIGAGFGWEFIRTLRERASKS